MKGRQALVNTVTGPVPVQELGATLMHEHLMIAYSGWEADTLSPSPGRDDCIAICVDKIQQMQDVGVKSMLDPCPSDLGRDVLLAAEVSSRTGFNIVCAAGLYKEDEGGRAYSSSGTAAGARRDRRADRYVAGRESPPLFRPGTPVKKFPACTARFKLARAC